MRWPRGIFVKLVLVFLLIGLLPFAIIGTITYHKAKERMTDTVVEYWLVRIARETAVALDREVSEMRGLVRSWADDGFLAGMLGEREPDPSRADLNASALAEFLATRLNYREDLDLLLLLGGDGKILAESWNDAGVSSKLRPARLLGLRIDEIVATEESGWLLSALDPTAESLRQKRVPVSSRDWHVSPLVQLAKNELPWRPEEGYPKLEGAYSLGFAASILDHNRKSAVGALVAIFNWSKVHDVLDQVGQRFGDPDDQRTGNVRYGSGYPFLFAQDGDTVIGHHYRVNLGTSLARDHNLPSFRERMLAESYGAYRYEYPLGTQKISGFAHTAPPLREGFGWVVGVGINHDQIYADVRGLFEFLVAAALLIAGFVILLAAVFSHRLTEPITRLIAYTEEVARGNLDARVDIRTKDEIAVLADSFNRMAEDVKETNRRLIKAEKDAAWKEMARQVAHEIKNPLTPIVLSAQQLRQAWADRHHRFDEILKDGVATIIDQSEALRKIAADFGAFATFAKREPREESAKALVRAAYDSYRARSEGSRIKLELDDRLPEGVRILVDSSEMKRVFLNLLNNAFEALEAQGGTVTLRATRESGPVGPEAHIAIADDGPGIAPEVRSRLFEPYFSTRTQGTGLGLAICKRIIEESGGRIHVTSEPNSGATFTLALPALIDPPTPI